VALLATLKKDRLGDWSALGGFAADLRRRDSAALAALSNLLGAPAEEQRELSEWIDVLVEVASDLRAPKGARLSAARCALECAVAGERLGALFAGAGDLATDPRLGAAARRLAEAGLSAALQAGLGREVSLDAASFARAVHGAASAVGKDRVRDLLDAAGPDHAGAAAGRFALALAELPEQHRAGWRKLLGDECAAFRRAPPAARRMGLAPPWPPTLPDAFAPFVAEAEAATAGISAVDAAAPRPVAKPNERRGMPAAGSNDRSATPAPKATQAAAVLPPGSAPAPPPTPAARGVKELGTKRLAAPIRQSAVRRSIGTVIEAPPAAAPRMMPPVVRPARDGGDSPSPAKAAPLPGLAPLRSRVAPDVRYGPDGRRIPREDRWRTDKWEWETPVLPPSTVPPPRRAAIAPGPFEARVRALFDGRPEAVERLCAAVEARAAVSTSAAALDDLARELALPRWRDRRIPREQVVRLQGTAAHAGHPEVWRSAAALLLEQRDFFL
jgi:hypothetical protein